MPNEDNLISTLEHSLRQFKSAQKRLEERLKAVRVEISKYENEAALLEKEINALKDSAVKTEEALETLTGKLRK